MSRYALPAVLAVALVPHPAAAEHAAVAPGSLLRITAPAVANAPLIGTLVDNTAAELTILLPDSAKSAIPRAAITKLERSTGRHSRAGKGALFGAVIGAGLGLAWGAGAVNEGGDPGCEDAGCLAVVGTVGGGIGAGLGALIGLAFKTYDWKETPLSQVQVSLQPVRGGARAAVAFTW